MKKDNFRNIFCLEHFKTSNFNFKIPKINFPTFENLMLKNSKFQGVFPLTFFQGKLKIFKVFLVLKCSRQKLFRKFFFFQNSGQNSQN
jgi:hypothetical protein